MLTKQVLGLQHGQTGQTTTGTSEADVLRRTLDEAFETLADVLTGSDVETPADVMTAVGRCRAELAAGAGADVLDPLVKSCFESMRHMAAHARTLAAERRAQIAALVATVRETVTTIAGDHETLQTTLTGSATRFERLAQVDDLQQIQAQLVNEVSTLTRITIERRAAWEQTSREFGTRLTSLETKLDDTRREAALDSLTNVANRRAFERACRDWLRPNGPTFVIAMVDVDEFKSINDQYGHAVGDQVLVTVAETLGHSLRGDDLVARLGGDEFAVLAAGLTLGQAEGRFAVIGRAVSDACRPLMQGGITPSISIGIAECSAGDTLPSLQQRADEGLYQAKRSGKGRVAAKPSPFIRDLLKAH